MTAPDFEATADAFGRLADPVRVEILATLWQAEDSVLPYSELRDAVGLRDSGRFNYHLTKLTDQFVAKTDDGYRLRPSGLVVLNAVYAGSYVDAPTRTGLDVAGSCPTCGSALVGEYDEGMFRVNCEACDDQVFMLSFPPRGVTQRSDEELVRAVSLHARAHTRRSNNGLCPFCGGAMSLSLDLDAETTLPATTLVRSECGNCGVTNRSSVGFAVLEHPAVAGFLREQGVPADAPPWRFDWCLNDDAVTVVSENPPEAAVTASANGAALRVTLDADADVVATERVEEA
ncbi:ArsR/SmtB family transcription factor [Halobacterium litoreum]|uniref:ArsR/SmtB family transcription factor n=1 Tax=Halobacterium litoreum TaxID=2039234 RepID=A0ABD5NFV5_9EURY|nr:helix-turn-helix domain-containing protein [Halobacterium litoreum]UHH13172.1 helix-turn-helix domain-containing protein [Halobacterium litoreum]